MMHNFSWSALRHKESLRISNKWNLAAASKRFGVSVVFISVSLRSSKELPCLHRLPNEGYKELQINIHLFSLQLYRSGVTSIVSCDPQYFTIQRWSIARSGYYRTRQSDPTRP